MTDPRALAEQIEKELESIYAFKVKPIAQVYAVQVQPVGRIIERVLRAHQDAQSKGKAVKEHQSVTISDELRVTLEQRIAESERRTYLHDIIDAQKRQLAACVQERDRLRGALEQIAQQGTEVGYTTTSAEIATKALAALPPTS